MKRGGQLTYLLRCFVLVRQWTYFSSKVPCRTGGRTIDHLMYVVLWNVKRQSLCIEWHLPSKVLLMCPSVFQPSVNHHIRQRHISLRNKAEKRNEKCFPTFPVSPLEDRNRLFSLLSLSPFRSADCHIRIGCQSKGSSDKVESIYLSITVQPIAEISKSKRHPNLTSCTSPPLAPTLPHPTLLRPVSLSPIKIVNLSEWL